MATVATTLYRLYDATDKLLYVGISDEPQARFMQHGAAKTWWPDVGVIRCVEYPTRDEAAEAELTAIRTEEPLHNVMGTPRMFGRRRSRPVLPDDKTPSLMGAQEIAGYLRVSRQRVTQLTHSPTFPPPLDTLAMGKVWAAEDVERWARERGRLRT